jgi:hypothetical protein
MTDEVMSCRNMVEAHVSDVPAMYQETIFAAELTWRAWPWPDLAENHPRRPLLRG